MKQTMRMFMTLIVCAVTLTGAAWAADDRWSFEISPYLWAVSIDGSVTVDGQTADFSADFADLVKDVNFGAELAFQATYKRLVLFGQADYMSLSDDFTTDPGGDFNANTLFVAAAAGYRFEGFTQGSTMAILGGVRYLRMSNKLDVNGVGRFDKTDDSKDVMVMLRSTFPLPRLSKKMALQMAASIGAGDSKFVWELQPQLQYQFNETLAGRIGFRRLQYKWEKSGNDLDMGFQGFTIGLGIAL